MRIKSLILVAAVLGLMACSWVKLTPSGEKVRVLSDAEVAHCKKLGKTTANVTNKVAGLERKEKIVQENLEVLARNAAAEMGGDTIVPIGLVQGGQQTFNVYRCIEP
ncbi:MAG: DUF4156 domain-containing protein [Gammaproteobacteria bacterium]|nr:DUF4156 domain-containing protein [Gammaproteobacteria bacterium]